MVDYKKYTLLVVDDEKLLREVICFDFQKKGFTILSADGPNQAFEIIENNKVDIVLSDMRMPEGGGKRLLELIRAHNPVLPLVFLMTGHNEVSEAEWLSNGAFGIILKPFDRKTLMDSITKALDIVDREKPSTP